MCAYVERDIFEELVYMITEVKKSHILLSSVKRHREPGGFSLSLSFQKPRSSMVGFQVACEDLGTRSAQVQGLQSIDDAT